MLLYFWVTIHFFSISFFNAEFSRPLAETLISGIYGAVVTTQTGGDKAWHSDMATRWSRILEWIYLPVPFGGSVGLVTFVPLSSGDWTIPKPSDNTQDHPERPPGGTTWQGSSSSPAGHVPPSRPEIHTMSFYFQCFIL